MTKSKPTLWMLHVHIPSACEEGRQAALVYWRDEPLSEHPTNPYARHTNEWRSWNHGWNAAFGQTEVNLKETI